MVPRDSRIRIPLHFLFLALLLVAGTARSQETGWEEYASEHFTLEPRESLQLRFEYGQIPVRSWLLVVDGGGHIRGLAQVLDRARDTLEFLGLTHIATELAGNLSGGQKKLLELGRTMMVDAKIVFLDEVGAGVNRTLLNTIADAILRLNRDRNYTFVVIEHDMDFIDKLCDPVICMAEGKVLAEGTLAEIKANEQVIEAYLGTGLKNKVAAG